MIDGAQVRLWASVEGLTMTNACRLYREGEQQLQFAGLAVAQYRGAPDCYLFFCDEKWETRNDTDHRTIDEAKLFAEQLFPGIGLRWQEADAG